MFLHCRASRYDEEILSVGWNPTIGLMALAGSQEATSDVVEDLASFDVDHFLDRVYALASHV